MTTSDTPSSTRLSTIAASGPLPAARYTASGSVCVRPGDVAGERDGGPELTERPRPREHRAGDERRRDQRQGHPPEHRPCGAPRVAAASS